MIIFVAIIFDWQSMTLARRSNTTCIRTSHSLQVFTAHEEATLKQTSMNNETNVKFRLTCPVAAKFAVSIIGLEALYVNKDRHDRLHARKVPGMM
jgi:hypothetical protein